MSWIKTVGNDEAQGRLKALYDAAIQRAGRVYNIVRIMGLSPATLEASMALYRAAMFGPSPLSRAQRELLATVVSAENECFY
jgi:alkylhydroperoxidase family enzyme